MKSEVLFPAEPLKTAVLFLVFNRPDTTRKVFEAIRNAKPPRLYVAADGPRVSRAGEVERVQLVREIATNVDWPCEVKTLFRNENLGCKYAVSSAIDWFFDHEEQGVILEDDCLPSIEFFRFSEDMLVRYKAETRVMMVTGTNYLSGEIEQPYFFSEHFTIWGWATWRRAWALYDVEMKFWTNERSRLELSEKYGNKWIRKHFELTFNGLSEDYIDTWDIQWVFSGFINRCFCITPRNNLVSNIGVIGTHGQGVTDSHFLKTDGLKQESYLNYSPTVLQNFNYDNKLHKLKNIPAVRKKLVIGILKKLRLFNLIRPAYKVLTGIR